VQGATPLWVMKIPEYFGNLSLTQLYCRYSFPSKAIYKSSKATVPKRNQKTNPSPDDYWNRENIHLTRVDFLILFNL